MSFRSTLSGLLNNIQCQLFPALELHVGPISDEHKHLTTILELVKIEDYLPCTKFNFGRPVKPRSRIARAFIAKVILKIPNTELLITRLKSDMRLRIICGWEAGSKIPSSSTFSRAFKEFSKSSLPEKVQQVLISEFYKDKIIGHLTKDSTPIIAREKALKKEGSPKERKKKQNERYLKEKKGEILSRRQKQLQSGLDEMLKELPKSCDIGMKKNAQGFGMIWKGYKLHAAVDELCIPIATILTSASLNDSEAAIPLATKADKVAKNFYDLMDSAYDEKEIIEHSRSLGHVPITDKHSRSKTQKAEKEAEKKRKRILSFSTAEDQRYKARFSKERFNAVFKDNYGGNNIIYRGIEKVSCHVMFGILALTASTILSLV
jgi:Transposase DDE domain/Transposase domain (DUF772)